MVEGGGLVGEVGLVDLSLSPSKKDTPNVPSRSCCGNLRNARSEFWTWRWSRSGRMCRDGRIVQGACVLDMVCFVYWDLKPIGKGAFGANILEGQGRKMSPTSQGTASEWFTK